MREAGEGRRNRDGGRERREEREGERGRRGRGPAIDVLHVISFKYQPGCNSAHMPLSEVWILFSG